MHIRNKYTTLTQNPHGYGTCDQENLEQSSTNIQQIIIIRIIIAVAIFEKRRLIQMEWQMESVYGWPDDDLAVVCLQKAVRLIPFDSPSQGDDKNP